MNEENKVGILNEKLHPSLEGMELSIESSEPMVNHIDIFIDYAAIKEQIITAIKVKFKKEFGYLDGTDVNERDGYFIAGFVQDVLNDLFPTKD